MTWNDFDRLETEHYNAMFSEHNREVEMQEEPIAWYVWWESDSESCADSERIEAETAEIAEQVFREFVEDGENSLPRDAVISGVRKDEWRTSWG